ncbi:DUF4962 domain-containing protein [Paenibacillus sp. CF384]|uniref:DUF4962 domain-containing protein n=1 Tax=Paenibacillus sp. CF384 TaxID=1884382 RepID=UPI000899BC9A|nr:DUF4962 domain-containing protein [Paenibacillus sp. CF384]SDX08914.1 Heparinase II/III-like protein [Paenibacillus sp. CF384]
MSKLFEPVSGLLTVPYEPNEASELRENPPRFTWMPAKPDEDRYMLQVSASERFEADQAETIGPIPYNFYTPDHVYEPGIYYWRYALVAAGASEQSDWSRVRTFTVPASIPETPLPAPGARYDETSFAHPRLWLDGHRVEALRGRIREDGSTCGFDVFYEKSVRPWMERTLIAEPERYPDNKRVAKLWRRMYMDCQETLYAIRHLSVAGVLLEDEPIVEQAKRWLLHVISWDPQGTTSRDYNDEAAFRIAQAVAWGYDWLHGYLSEEERSAIRANLLVRTEQVAFHVIERSRIHRVPYDSHAVRSLSSVLVPACIAMLHEEPKAREWLDYTLEYYACLYSPWGGQDGGWAEGPMYWTTGLAYLIDAFNLIRQYVGIDLFERPFFMSTGDFPLYVQSPDTVRASFGDQSTLGEPPSLKTAYNIRQFAGLTGNGLYQWYYEQVKERDKDADSKFYNYGWWDFRFDDLLYAHDYPAVEPLAPEPGRIEPVKWFRDVGWVAFHRRMDDPSEHIQLIVKSSSYGSISHSHGDQNGFLLHAFGEPIAIDSGYYVAHGSTMHRNWRRQTISKNNLLIDGKGQYAGADKVLCKEAYGLVEEVSSKPGFASVRMNATEAYRATVPYLKQFVREVYWLDDTYAVIVDAVDLDQPGRVTWLMHTLQQMELKGQTFRAIGAKAEMDGRFVYASSGDLTLRQHDQFTDVDPSEYEGLANQWHLLAETKEAKSHRIVTLLVPMKKGEDKFVSYFIDDQDHGIYLYFTNEDGATRMIAVPKAY